MNNISKLPAGRTVNKEVKELATFYNLKAVSYFHLNKYPEAENLLKEGVALDPANMEILKNLAEILYLEKKLEAAIPYYVRAIEIEPKNQELVNRLARIYANLKKFDLAYELDKNREEILNIIFAEIFKFEGHCVQCGACCKNMVLMHSGKIIESEAEFKKVCQTSPDFNRWVPFTMEDKSVRFNCSKLSPEGKCTDYQNRQTLCRIYPNHLTTGLKDNCGFKRKTELDYPPIKNLALINAIARRAMKFLLFEEAIKILELAPEHRSELGQVFQESLQAAAK